MMSITLSFVLLLVLLCFPYDACNARSFGVVRNETTISKEDEDYYKLNNIPTRASTKTSIPNATEVVKEESRFEKEDVAANIGGSNEPEKQHIQAKENIPLEVSSGATQRASVSWTVPHKKTGEKEPGFNLDYLPPKTHPPVHN